MAHCSSKSLTGRMSSVHDLELPFFHVRQFVMYASERCRLWHSFDVPVINSHADDVKRFRA